jgi:conjugal transfer pilus assembly protein TrbC
VASLPEEDLLPEGQGGQLMKRLLVGALTMPLLCSNVWGVEDSRKTAQIMTPDGICASVSKVDGNKVFLTSRKGRCKPMPVPVTVDNDVFKVDVYLDGKQWQEQGLTAAVVPDMEMIQALSRELNDNIKLPDPEKNKAATETGRKMGDYMKSEGYQTRVAAEADRIRNEVMGEEVAFKKYYPDAATAKKAEGHVLGTGERVYVFISASMPVETLRNYAISIDKAGDPNVVMVMRGMIGGVSKLVPTMEFIGKVLIKDNNCLAKSMQAGGTIECDTYGAEVIIDPMLFTRYNIFKVPAVVYATGVTPFDLEASEGTEENTKVGSSKTVYGDASLDGIVETIAENTKSKTLEALFKKMRAGYYN